MCLMHKYEDYGKLTIKEKHFCYNKHDNKVLNKELSLAKQVSKHLPYEVDEIEKAVIELVEEKVCYWNENTLCQKRMVNDNIKSQNRSKAGRSGMNSRWNKDENSSGKESKKEIPVITKDITPVINPVITKDITTPEYEIENEIENRIEELRSNINSENLEKINFNNLYPNQDFHFETPSEMSNLIRKIIQDFNKVSGLRFRVSGVVKRNLISLFNEGYIGEEMIEVMKFKIGDWINDKKMRHNINPTTIFGDHFEKYTQQMALAKIPIKEEKKIKSALADRIAQDKKYMSQHQ